MDSQSLADTTPYRFFQIVSQDSLPNGERLFVEVEGLPIVILNIGGIFYAIDDVCTHDNGPLGDGDLDGHTIICPRHGARFDIRNGKALSLPAYKNIDTYPVRVVSGMIEIGVPA